MLYGCLRRTGREVQFLGGENKYTSVRIAGRFVAARDHWDSGAPDPCYGVAVAVMNLAAAPDGQGLLGQRYREERGNCEGKEELDLPTSIIVKRNGAVAYLRCASIERGFAGRTDASPARCASSSSTMLATPATPSRSLTARRRSRR